MKTVIKAVARRGVQALSSGVILVTTSQSLQAQEAPEHDWTFTLSAGGIYAPEFQGSKDYEIIPFPDLKVEYKDCFFASFFDGVGYNVINENGWRIGPIAKYAFGRNEDDNAALRGLGDVDDTFEVGGFVEYNFDPFTAKVEIRQGVNGHKGIVGEASADYMGSLDLLGSSAIFALGPRLVFSDKDYANAFFGVTGAQSVRSGLPSYKAGSGLISYGVGGFVVAPLTDSISLNVFAGYDRLAGDAADSPLVKQRGDENQFMVGIGVSYQFGF